MTNRLTREFVQNAARETTEELGRVGILKPGEYLELVDNGGTTRPIRLCLFSEGANERSTLLNNCNLRRALDGLETLRALAYFAEFRLPADNTNNTKRPNPQVIATLTDGSQVAYMHGAVYVRSTIGGSWPLPLEESPTPHQPGTWYRGEW